MLSAVLDTTVLVAAILKPVKGGAAFELLAFAGDGAFQLYLSNQILDETADVLLNRPRLRRRYHYPDSAVTDYCGGLAQLAVSVISDPPPVQVVRDPNDNMIVACALAAGADYLVSRDDDLLSLHSHQSISMITPEAFLEVLRSAP